MQLFRLLQNIADAAGGEEIEWESFKYISPLKTN